MAAPGAPPADTEGSGLPFLGSLMSLISHGEIRYEGLLYNIDMPNSTIALSNVRCFGTEGRRKDGPEVPPSDQVFEYVVFKGTEIKELTVLQPPPPAAPPAPAPGGFQDPAIVSAGSTAPPGAPPAAGGPPGYGPIPPAAPSPWGPPPPPYGSQFGASPWGAPPPPVPAAGGAPPPQPAGQRAPAPAPTVAVTPAQQQQQGQQAVQQHQRPGGGALANGAGPKAGAGGQQAPRIVPVSYAHAAGGGRGGAGRGAQQRGRGGPQGSAGHPRGHAGGRGGGAGGAHTGVPRPPAVPAVEVPKEEFNFEEALKRFNKEEVLKEAGEEVPELATKAEKPAYTHDDFFDTLSCEALERKQLAESGEGRPDHRTKMAAMRKQDLETFGGMARGRPAYRGRGRGYGRGGRGGGRGNNAGRGSGTGRPARAEADA